MALTKPTFVDTDPAAIVQDMIAFYESATGKTLQPAQAERLIINAFAYREALLRNAINEAALQNLVDFSKFPTLDYLGRLVGVNRLPEVPAKCTLEFNIVAGHGGVVIPEGTRVSSTDGKAVFAVAESTAVAIGVFTATVEAVAVTPGKAANGYTAGTVNVILDPLAFVTSVNNTDTTGGGADEETDDQLRDRIKLAPESFSTAGSKGAYMFHAKSASSLIADVAVTSPVPGTVNIFPLVPGTLPTPTQILDDVEDICNGEKVRPLTDTVVVLSPTEVTYSVQVDLTLYTDANDQVVVDAVTAAIEEYTSERSKKLGRDIMLSQLNSLAMIIDEVYDCAVVLPAADVIIGETEVGVCTGITVNVIGTNNG